MEKCKTCIWADWRSGTNVFCPFPVCVKKEPEHEIEKVVDEKIEKEDE